ncbi:hypothetical protein [Pantoea stewartii]|nr:hypothetical protein [Pantoea stewartii]
MEITVQVTKKELEEMGVSRERLKEFIMEDLDDARDYVGFNVEVVIKE